MKRNVLVILLFSLIAASVAASVAEVTNENAVIKRSKRETTDLLEYNRKLIEELVAKLRQAAQQAGEALQTFSTGLQGQVTIFEDRITTEISRLRDRVTQAVQDFSNRFQNAGTAVMACVENHRNDANTLFTETVTKTMACAEDRITDIGTRVTDLANMTGNAIEYAESALLKARECTERNSDVMAAASCLGSIVLDAQIKGAGFAVQTGIAIARLNIAFNTLPVTLQACAAIRLVEAGFGTARIVMDIGSCSATSIFSALIGGGSSS